MHLTRWVVRWLRNTDMEIVTHLPKTTVVEKHITVQCEAVKELNDLQYNGITEEIYGYIKAEQNIILVHRAPCDLHLKFEAPSFPVSTCQHSISIFAMFVD